MPIEEAEKRISFDIPVSLHERLNNVVPWGAKSQLFRKLIEIAVTRIETGGYAVIGGILQGDLDPFRQDKED